MAQLNFLKLSKILAEHDGCKENNLSSQRLWNVREFWQRTLMEHMIHSVS